MKDAVEIRHTSKEQHSVGATFDCDTRIGPFRMTDRMVITEWLPAKLMSVRHAGIVTGTGTFMLAADGDMTVFSWREHLRFPWRFGGPIGSVVAKPIFVALWRGNLQRLKQRVEQDAHSTVGAAVADETTLDAGERQRPSRAPRVLAMAFLVSGILHFVSPGPFAGIIPRWVPRPTEAVYLSGGAELVCAAGLWRRARWSAYVSTALLILVFPANLQMAWDFQGDSQRSAAAKAATWLRLPLQAPLIWMALRARR